MKALSKIVSCWPCFCKRCVKRYCHHQITTTQETPEEHQSMDKNITPPGGSPQLHVVTTRNTRVLPFNFTFCRSRRLFGSKDCAKLMYLLLLVYTTEPDIGLCGCFARRNYDFHEFISLELLKIRSSSNT